MKLYFEADPDCGQPPLLLVHGLLSSRNHWIPNLELAKHFRRVRIDLPAHGLSPTPGEPSAATPEAVVKAIDEVRERLQIDRWHICGQSFGAALTLRYALTYPKRVLAQIFTNANGALRADWTRINDQRNRASIEDIRRNGHAAMRRMIYHPCHAKRFPPDVRDILSKDADATDAAGIILLLEQATPVLSVRERLGDLRPPTLLINGRWENQFQPARNWLSETHPHIVIIDIEGGHSINIERPQEFDAAVIHFLSAPERGPASQSGTQWQAK
ncbi:alpha/beta fold hydrolase [Sinorhizobium saheli]|uniref:alpha/beta fold hydrolase n=1 Tax=Sinorhizobium saheli TaxID=36856 RepID=UPI0009FE1920|nr:alpha/beta hydrolase [Sinorhizobium saheli]MQW86482.1 alpha/beta fold hydrolase [Sinorhizobium saheli]